ncbi:GGDEF domain-containing protein [Vibrio salinus]|uniref:GGDEF domain-containing protein n=1 Tax=Vibrio salinus TaxID=2899784 RepID=UPI001E57D815|nr:GGDEF domain-containing protein [Vibrio salinus]MCE0492631.1 diguanylate cyclase [Vibrio salinus]
MKTKTFLWLLRFAFVCFALIWGIDYYCGIIVSFDAVSYPLCMTAFFCIYLLARRQWVQEEYLHLCAYIVVAGFLTASSIWHHMVPVSKFSNSAQWLGLNYVMAYLFLSVRRATVITTIVLPITLIGHFLAVKEHNNLEDSLGIILNIGVAHMVYIVLLWTVLKMRIRDAQTEERLRFLEHYSLIDPLTHILNRRGIENIFHRLKTQSPHRFAMILIDIDHFKAINDQFGHTAGDAVLKGIVQTIQKYMLDEDEIGRWGGEEFLLTTVGQTRRQVFEFSERLRNAVRSERYVDGCNVTISIGIGYSDQTRDMNELFLIADKNLYVAKQRGRNQVAASACSSECELDNA